MLESLRVTKKFWFFNLKSTSSNEFLRLNIYSLITLSIFIFLIADTNIECSSSLISSMSRESYVGLRYLLESSCIWSNDLLLQPLFFCLFLFLGVSIELKNFSVYPLLIVDESFWLETLIPCRLFYLFFSLSNSLRASLIFISLNKSCLYGGPSLADLYIRLGGVSKTVMY